jgi:predicted DNA-binding transcriptional regulator AlpA
MKRLLRIPEFLELYSISRTAFYREVSAGRLMLTKIGTASRVTMEDAEAWAAALPKWDTAD